MSALERAALKALVEACPPETAAGLGLGWIEQNGAALAVAPALPASAITLNRGYPGGDLANAVSAYAGVARYFLHVEQLPPEETLAAGGLQPARAWQKFEHDLQTLPAVETDFDLRTATTDDGPALAEIICDGFDLGTAARPWIAHLPEAQGWTVCLACERGTPVAAGAVFVADDFGWLDFMSTRQAVRGRGAQTALLAYRLRLARELGCRAVFTCTGEAVPGDPQRSYANILKAGFRKAGLTRNLAPAA